MKKKILALVLALTMCFGTTMTANAAVNISNKMGATDTRNILDKNSSKIPKGTLQYLASKFKIEYTQQDLDALKKIFDANLYAKAYPDVAAAYGNDREALWNHYVTHGIKEGRTQINSGFNVFAYIAAYPDLRNAFGDDLMAYYVHYANYGMNENRKLITVDAVTKAGYTITGINGQVIAVPKLEPAPSTVDSVTEPDPAPAEEPASAQTPAPSVEPTPTPEEPSEPCEHIYNEYEYTGDKRHYIKCGNCHEYELNQEGNRIIADCISVVRFKDELGHQIVCQLCGGIINELVPHKYEYNESSSTDGTSIHIGTCACGAKVAEDHIYENNSNICSICKYERPQTEETNKEIENNTSGGENEDAATQ